MRTVVLALVSVVGWGCSGKQNNSPHLDQDPPPCHDPGPGPHTEGCPSGTCGGNSPAVNTFPINGVRKNGQCNREGVQLMPGTLRGGGCGQAASLIYDEKNNVLLGVNADSTEACREQAMVGATFDIRSFNGSTLTITISDSRMLEHPYEAHRGYKLEVGGHSLCESGASSDARTALGLTPYPPVGAIGPLDPDSDLIIPLEGEMWAASEQLADIWYAEVDRDKLLTGRWTHFACVEDALAKRTLFNLNPTGNPAKAHAALHMITANYCGIHAYTMRGIKIAWEEDVPNQWGQEAAWDENRALCLDKPRLLWQSDHASVPSGPDVPKPPTCMSGPCTVDQWLAGVRAECGLPDTCNAQGVLQSYAPKPGFGF